MLLSRTGKHVPKPGMFIMTSAVWVHLLHNSVLWVIVPWSLNFRPPLDLLHQKQATPNSMSYFLKRLMSCIEQSKSSLFTCSFECNLTKDYIGHQSTSL